MTSSLLLPVAQGAGKVKAPDIDWEAISPLVALTAGGVLCLLTGLLRARFARLTVTPLLAVLTLLATAGLSIWQWDINETVISGAVRVDNLTLFLTVLFAVAGIATTLLSLRAAAPEEAGHGEYYSLLLFSILGMVILAGSEDLVSVFIGYELLSIPLYILCATEMRRATSLESGLKYLIIGSVGSATLLYGLAFVYGATGSTGFGEIADATGEVAGDVLLLTGIALTIAGLAFKCSIAPFHQWTPDVYEGAPTPVTAFMAVATKVAAFGIFLRLFDVALIDAASDWAPALAVLAVVTIIVGNVGALTQTSLKRLLAYSSIAQAGYLLVGVVVTTRLGIEATAFYLAVYLLMNLAAFAVIIARERETGRGDDITILHGLGADRPWLAWPMTIAMLSLAGFPATAGFFGKIELIRASVDNGYAFLGVAIVLGSALSLAYYLRVVAAVWMRGAAAAVNRPPASLLGNRSALAGGSQEGDEPPKRRSRGGPSKGSGSGGGSKRLRGGKPGEQPAQGRKHEPGAPADKPVAKQPGGESPGVPAKKAKRPRAAKKDQTGAVSAFAKDDAPKDKPKPDAAKDGPKGDAPFERPIESTEMLLAVPAPKGPSEKGGDAASSKDAAAESTHGDGAQEETPARTPADTPPTVFASDQPIGEPRTVSDSTPGAPGTPAFNTGAGTESTPAEASTREFDPSLDEPVADVRAEERAGRTAESEPERRTEEAPLGVEADVETPPGPEDPHQPGSREGVRGADPGYLHSDRDAASGDGDAARPGAGRTLQAPADAPDRRIAQPEVIFVAVVSAAATIAFGIFPDPLLDVARDAASSFTNLVS